MNRGRIFFLAFAAFLAPILAGQSSPAGDRFLFIVCTSSTMERFQHAGRQAVFDLIYSGVNGQMRDGDTFGIWTFNESVSARFFPIQSWKPNASLQLAGHAGLFLKDQKYEKGVRFDRIPEYLLPLIRSVKDVNVFIIADGGDGFSGTSFDDPINEACRKIRNSARRNKTPVIITLVARQGEIRDWRVTIAGEAIKLPEPRFPVLASQTVETPKRETEVQTEPARLEKEKVIKIVTHPAPVVLPSENGNNTPSQAAEPGNGASKPDSDLTGPNPEKSQTVGASRVESISATPKSSEGPSAAITAKSQNPAHENAASRPSDVAEGRLQAQAAGAARTSATLPLSVAVAARETADATNNQPLKLSNSIHAMSAPPAPLISPHGFMLIGAFLLGTGLGLVLLIILRSRSTAQPSLITKSLERSGR